jgi:hypothetical protein
MPCAPGWSPSAGLNSSAKARIALLRLDDCPTDESAVDALWEENHVAIELEMKCHLHSATDPALLNRLVSGVISLSRYYCEEIDEPKAWVARCANLESRRIALQLMR